MKNSLLKRNFIHAATNLKSRLKTIIITNYTNVSIWIRWWLRLHWLLGNKYPR